VHPPCRFPRKNNVVHDVVINSTSLVMNCYAALVLFYFINKFNFQIKHFPKWSTCFFHIVVPTRPGSEQISAIFVLLLIPRRRSNINMIRLLCIFKPLVVYRKWNTVLHHAQTAGYVIKTCIFTASIHNSSELTFPWIILYTFCISNAFPLSQTFQNRTLRSKFGNKISISNTTLSKPTC